MSRRSEAAVRILSLDLATRTGWATRASGELLSGVQNFALQRGESPGMIYIHFRAWLRRMVENARIELVVYEMPHMRGGAASTLLIGLETRVHEVAAELGIEHAKQHSASIKLHCTGFGDALKTEVTRWAAIVLGRAPISDDEADAVALESLAQLKYNGVEEMVRIDAVERRPRKQKGEDAPPKKRGRKKGAGAGDRVVLVGASSSRLEELCAEELRKGRGRAA